MYRQKQMSTTYRKVSEYHKGEFSDLDEPAVYGGARDGKCGAFGVDCSITVLSFALQQ